MELEGSTTNCSWRCPWCNGYRRRTINPGRDTDCISHSTNTLGKGMNPIILPPAMGKQQDRLGSSALVRQVVQEKENSEFKPVKLRLKIDLVSYLARAEGLVNRTTNCSWFTETGSKRLEKKSTGIRNLRKKRNNPNHCIIKIIRNTLKNPGFLKDLLSLKLH